MGLYELAILGAASDGNRAQLLATLQAMVAEFELNLGDDILIHDVHSVLTRDRRSAFAAAFFGDAQGDHSAVVHHLINTSAPVIPTIGPGQTFESSIPQLLRASNGLRRRSDDPQMTELATSLLECVGLLRRQRRVFVSYRRTESRSAAMQLHDLLTSRGFDVFLDTHDVRPGEPFQEVLWNRLCDADVVVMLDTPTYFESRWTRAEIGRARAKEIHVLRVIWPGNTPNKMLDMAETIYLDESELTATDGPIVEETVNSIVLQVERLRSRSIASRYMSITGKLRSDVTKVGAEIVGIGAHRAIAIRLLDERKVWAYPVVGIPTAELLNDVADKARRADQGETPILVYDHLGISEGWIAHLRWLDDNIRSVRAIKVSEAAWTLADWCPS